MVLKTFENLSAEKKKRIFQALLNEFGEYPLEQAQVARIIKEVAISRGSFYKYFTDINDAYWYVYKVVLSEVHAPILNEKMTTCSYVKTVREFVEQTTASAYFEYIRMHLCVNESSLGKENKNKFTKKPSSYSEWAVMILAHEVIKQILLYPNMKDQLIGYLDESVQKLMKEG